MWCHSQLTGQSTSTLLVEMFAMRPIPLPIHAAASVLGGLALVALPFVLGFSVVAAAISIVLGVVLVGVALDEVDDGSRGLPLRAHFSFDVALGIVLAAAALVLALAGDLVAAGVFSIGALTHLTLTLSTRYTAAR